MSKVTIRGHSDDIIYIEGDFREELYYKEPKTDAKVSRNFLAFGDGTLLSIFYDGEWRINRKKAGSAIYTKVEANEAGGGSYSDIVTLEGDLHWVLFGHEHGMIRSKEILVQANEAFVALQSKPAERKEELAERKQSDGTIADGIFEDPREED
jgi:hypothetical protein